MDLYSLGGLHWHVGLSFYFSPKNKKANKDFHTIFYKLTKATTYLPDYPFHGEIFYSK